VLPSTEPPQPASVSPAGAKYAAGAEAREDSFYFIGRRAPQFAAFFELAHALRQIGNLAVLFFERDIHFLSHPSISSDQRLPN
jgi:hypothetical protein